MTQCGYCSSNVHLSYNGSARCIYVSVLRSERGVRHSSRYVNVCHPVYVGGWLAGGITNRKTDFFCFSNLLISANVFEVFVVRETYEDVANTATLVSPSSHRGSLRLDARCVRHVSTAAVCCGRGTAHWRCGFDSMRS